MVEKSWANDPVELAALLNLTRARGVGSIKIRKLIQAFGTPSRIFAAAPKSLKNVSRINDTVLAELERVRSLSFGDDQLAQCEARDARIITLWSDNYPPLLKKIDDSPILLFVKGESRALAMTALAIVGTRSPSNYGKQVAEKLAVDLVAKNIATVSGFARGIDTIVHSATVKNGGVTIAVIGCGLDIMYPPENRKLADVVVENGLFVSEFPMGTNPDAINFPRRNRIISGLSLGTIVVEARAKSGALITGNLALEQNREVFAVPGSIFSPLSHGPHALIKDGAKLVHSVDDILDEVSVQGKLFNRHAVAATHHPRMSEKERIVYSALDEKPVHVDQLAAKVALPTSELLSVLLQLEFSGLVRQTAGKMFSRM